MIKTLTTRIAALVMTAAPLLLYGCGGSGDVASSSTQDAALVARSKAKLAAVGISNVAGVAEVVGLMKIGETRVSRTEYDYIFQVRVVARSASLTSASVTLSSAGAGSKIIDGSAIAYDLPVDTPVLTSDTITVRHDRSLPFDESRFVWAATGPTGLFALPIVNKPANDSDFVPRPAGIDVVANQLIVTTKPETTDEQLADLLLATKMRVVGRVPMARIFQIEALEPVTVDVLESLASRIRQDSAVKYVSFNARQKPSAMALSPDDPTYTRQKWAFDAINTTQAWKYLNDHSKASQNPTTLVEVKVGVIDSGFDGSHRDLVFERLIGPDGSTAPGAANPQAISAADRQTWEAFSKAWGGYHHGMNVAGTIAATHNNQMGATGVLGDAPRKLYGARVSRDAMSTVSNIARLIVNGIRVINISMGPDWPVIEDTRELDESRYAPEDALQFAGVFGDLLQELSSRHDFLLIIAAGNEQASADLAAYGGPLFSADDSALVSKFGIAKQRLTEFVSQYEVARSRIVLVGATQNRDIYDNSVIPLESGMGQEFASSYSNFGRALHVVAPGGGNGCRKNETAPFDPPGFYHGDKVSKWFNCPEGLAGVTSLGFGTPMTTMHGTSQAAPFVSGAAALIFSLRPDLAAQDVKSILLSSETRISDSYGTKYPLLGLDNAVKQARLAKRGVSPTVSSTIAVITEAVCRLPDGNAVRNKGAPVTIMFDNIPGIVFKGKPNETTNDYGFNFIEIPPEYVGRITTANYTLTVGPGGNMPKVERTGTVPIIKGGVLTFTVASEAASGEKCGGVEPIAIEVKSNTAIVNPVGPSTILFADRFESSTLDTNKWRAAPANASTTILGAYAISNGALRVDVPGGTNGYMGKNSGNAFYPRTGPISGDFTVTARLTEILRSSAQRDNSGLSLIYGRTRIGLRGNYSGYWWDGTYGIYRGHRLEAASYSKSCLLRDDLDLSTMYAAEVRIRRSGSLGYVGYRASSAAGWTEAPCDLDASGEVRLEIESGDGGYTFSTGRLTGAFDDVEIRVP